MEADAHFHLPQGQQVPVAQQIRLMRVQENTIQTRTIAAAQIDDFDTAVVHPEDRVAAAHSHAITREWRQIQVRLRPGRQVFSPNHDLTLRQHHQRLRCAGDFQLENGVLRDAGLRGFENRPILDAQGRQRQLLNFEQFIRRQAIRR